MNNTNFQTFHQMGNAINDFVKQATGRDNVQNIDIDHVTVAQNHYYEEVDVSGPIASFMASIVAPLDSCVVNIQPIQSGSGDPAPDNVRPITGWTGANVTRVGINIWDEEWEVGRYNVNTGEKEDANNVIRCKNMIPVVPGTKYYINANYAVSCCYDANKNYISSTPFSYATIPQTYYLNIPSNAYYITFNMGSGYGTTYNHNISINYPFTDTDYHPGHAQTYPIDWQTEAGTVYGGHVDLVTGELVVDRANIASYNGETLPGEWISDRDVYEEGTTPTTGAQVVYELAEPQTYQLTPVEIRTLLGQNNIWADTGSIEVKFTDIKELY